MMYPLLPALIISLGGGAVSLGLLDGISDAISAGAKLVAGKLADRAGLRRALVIAGYAVAAAVRPLVGAASHAWQVIGLRATDRVGKGIRSPARDAVIADATPREIRGRAFGFHRAMDHSGAVVGPLIAWALIEFARMPAAAIIRWSILPGIVAVVFAWFAMAQARTSAGHAGRAPKAGASTPVLVGPDAQRGSIAFYLVVLFWLIRFPETLLLLRLQDIGLPVAAIPLVWAALHVVRTSTSYSGGKLADRLGPVRTMIWGWLVYAGVCVGLASTESRIVAIFWFLVFGLVAALTEPPERALVANLKAKLAVGSRFGIYYASIGVAALLGGILYGLLYSRVSGPFALAASAAGTSALLLAGGALIGWTVLKGRRQQHLEGPLP